MRTTIDLPDALFREVKSTAASRGLKLKEFITESLRATLDQSGVTMDEAETAVGRHRKQMEEFFIAIDKDSGQTGPVGRINREELHERHD